MKERLARFAEAFATRGGTAEPESEARRSLRHPLVFLLVGERTEAMFETLYALNQRQWAGHEGIMYLLVSGLEATEKAGSGSEGARGRDAEPDGLLRQGRSEAGNVFRWLAPGGGDGLSALARRTLRPQLIEALHRDETRLRELNVQLRRLMSRIGENGRLYGSLQQVQVMAVARADDPANALLPELTVLLKSVLAERFRSVNADMFAIVREKQTDGEYAWDAAQAVGFLHELDRLQSRGFVFEAPLQATADGLKLPAQHGPSPLFDTAYVIGDKDERGLYAADADEACGEIVSRVSFLRCRTGAETDDPQSGYNYQQFRQSMAPPGAAEPYYASAGFARMTRPDRAIALTTLHLLHRRVMKRLQEGGELGQRELLEALDWGPSQVEAAVDTAFDGAPDLLDEMNGLLHEAVPPGELRRMSLRQAENALFGGNARDFFERQAERLRASLGAGGGEKRLRQAVERRLLLDARYGLWAVYRWTDGGERQGLTAALADWRFETERALADGRAELEALYESEASQLPAAKTGLLGLFGGRGAMRTLASALLGRVYGLKRELLWLELKRELLLRCERTLALLHEQTKQYAERLQRLDKLLQEASRLVIARTNEELGRNMYEYYGQATESVAAELEARWGERFEFGPHGLGPVSELLAQSDDAYIERLMSLAEGAWFRHPLFNRPFEQELLARANVTVSYADRQTLTPEELYRELCHTLDEEAAVRADVYRFTHRHRHDESYLFGDRSSELVQYALHAETEGGFRKLGCIDVKRDSGVEKLRLMGGFRRDDLMLMRTGSRYYDTYAAEGYRFHRPGWEIAASGAAGAANDDSMPAPAAARDTPADDRERGGAG